MLAACGGSDDSGDGPGGNGGSGGSSGNAGTGAIAGAGASIGTGGNGGSGAGGGGSPEVCDGIDNDNNGIVDDLDVGNDGICDCLRIATLGVKGQWGTGDVFASWLDARSDNGATDLADQVLTNALIKDFQVIVVQNISEIGRSYSDAEVQALQSWVKAGGGVMTLIGYGDSSERTNVNTLLAPLGVSYGPEQILQKQSADTVPITGWTSHPVTQGVTLVGVDNGYPVNGAGTVLATEQGYDVLRAVQIDQGHVLVWSDEWITYNSEWTGHPEYQVELFWLNAIKWLTPAKECQVDIPPVT
jgi:hypothetical protein